MGTRELNRGLKKCIFLLLFYIYFIIFFIVFILFWVLVFFVFFVVFDVILFNRFAHTAGPGLEKNAVTVWPHQRRKGS